MFARNPKQNMFKIDIPATERTKRPRMFLDVDLDVDLRRFVEEEEEEEEVLGSFSRHNEQKLIERFVASL